LYLVFDDTNGNEYRFKTSGYFNDLEFVAKPIAITNIIPGDGAEDFPMYLKAIYIDLANGIQSGTLYFDRIRCTYPNWTSIEKEPNSSIPSEFKLLQNYPNPFNPLTAINYELSDFSNVNLSIFNINGKKITTLVNSSQESGSYTVHFDASMLSGGVYFYRLQTENWTDTKKMLLLK
jgi:type IX secretion system substrate protein